MSRAASPPRRESTKRVSVPPPANAKRFESGIRELKPKGRSRPSAPVPKAAKPLRSVPPPTPAARQPTSSPPAARKVLRPAAKLRSTPPPIPAAARKKSTLPPPLPKPALRNVTPVPVSSEVRPETPPPTPRPHVHPMVEAEAVEVEVVEATQPQKRKDDTLPETPQAVWPEQPAESDPYIQSLRRSASLMPAPVQAMVRDVRDSITPDGRVHAKKQLRDLRRDGVVQTVRWLRAAADKLSEYA